MRINFYPLRQFQLDLAALGAAGPVGAGIAAAQTALGIVQAIQGGNKSKRLLGQRRAYQTPEEIYDVLRARQSRAAGGYDPATLDYLTNQVDRGFASSADVLTRLGGDPNQLSSLYEDALSRKFKIGAENQLLNMQNFSGYIDALNLVAGNKAAEQKSQQDIIKDKLQAASMEQQAGLQNIKGGTQVAFDTITGLETADLYREIATPPVVPGTTGYNGPTNFNFAPSVAPAGVDIGQGFRDMFSPTTSQNTSPVNQAQLQQAIDLIERYRRQKGG